MTRTDTIQMLYSSRMSKQETIAELEEFIPRIVRFVQRYVNGSSPPEPDNFRGSICSIHDIEENIWEPRLGVKGKVDVTVEVKIHNRKKVMPLELKTGRSSFSAEHRGQVILYTMMMTQLGNKVDSGLLLYLRDGKMQEVSAGNNECRDLTILRNQLAHFVTRIPAICDDGSAFKPPQLPEPISHHSACGKCPYLTLCSSFLRNDGLEAVSSSNPLSSLATASTSHLCKAHLDYLIHWTGLLLLEESESTGSVQAKDMWCLTPEQRNLSQCNTDTKFHLDTYTSLTSKVFNLTNVGCLMDDTVGAGKLRKLIIDKEQPTFMEKLQSSILRPGRAILEPLNMGQRRAVVKALTAHDYMLIKGMPGTGKTATIVSLVELLVKLGQSVLVTSHTHSAVDNVLLKLTARGVDLLRLGSSNRIHPQLSDKSEQSLTSGCTTPEQLETAYNSKLVVGTTCLGAGHPLFTRRSFDVCVVDESTQVLQVSVLRPLFSAKKFILIGDPEQLPPIVRNKRAREMGMSESLFARLDSPVATVCLDLQYRMNQAITELANALTYNGQLKCGSETVSLATLKLTAQQHVEDKLKEEPWLHNVLSSSMEHSVVMLDTGNAKSTLQEDSSFTLLLQEISKEERGCTNICEAAVIHYIVAQLIKVTLLRKVVIWDDVEVNTVDQYQGRDKDVIIFSCTKTGKIDSTKIKESEILSDKRRLTVAITRAKHKMLAIGDVAALQVYSPFKKLFDCLSHENKCTLSDGANGFQWENILENLKNVCCSGFV
ncbi:DNA replication ATP-dependent helicase/nuclease DNA2 [Blattella germanica]|nr:DNA replication ATP-dependent helicase/nuclease DNA2 [Blattella germanica]